MKITKKIFPFSIGDAFNSYKQEDLLKDKAPFKSYQALARELKPGQKVKVRVVEVVHMGPGKKFETLAGYGEVGLSMDGKSFSSPRQLQHDF